ncbi:MAG: toxin-antitoxin system toxin subunit [Oscillospiraceae bacterium]|nr:toxin-antitoxin system toxin subunit [Oscillospiraceae bacterium]
MLTIIELAAREDDGHGLQSQSHRTENWMGEEWIEVPPQLEQAVWDCCGYCTLDIQDGKLVGVTPVDRPPEPEPEPTPEEDLAGLLIDQEYRLTLLELGV